MKKVEQEEQKGICPMLVKEPSDVLFELLRLLDESCLACYGIKKKHEDP